MCSLVSKCSFYAIVMIELLNLPFLIVFRHKYTSLLHKSTGNTTQIMTMSLLYVFSNLLPLCLGCKAYFLVTATDNYGVFETFVHLLCPESMC